ncbi:hypothetical protein B0T20DRAFT_472539 [Sordaria brevicollis]|uniref:Uncharacterized protein n=1 Tax=Sordaria brevicollis TaxID=83679 RepID=A0AAE0P1T4_SORBR|nr:hypothetical protein B0T20DRAFT_472539 [Sordaria brevicollis]
MSTMSDSSLPTATNLQASQTLPVIPDSIPRPSTPPTKNTILPRRHFNTPPKPPKPALYTPSLPCLHCTLSSSRCSLQNSKNHHKPPPLPPDEAGWMKWKEKYMAENFQDGQWKMYDYYSRHPNEPVRGLEGGCRRCRRAGGGEDGDGDGDGGTSEAGRWVEDGFGGWVKVNTEGRLVRRETRVEMDERKENNEGDVESVVDDGGKGDHDGSSGSVIRRSRQQDRFDIENDYSDEDVDWWKKRSSSTASGTRNLTKFLRSANFSNANPTLSRRDLSTSPEKVNDNADKVDEDEEEDDNNDDTNSSSDVDPDSDPDFDARSNVSSKTPPSLPPPPQPPKPIPHNVPKEPEASRTLNHVCFNKNIIKRNRKPFSRENHASTPLFAAITAVEVTKSDILELIPPSKKAGGIKQFLFSRLELPLVAYVRSPGLSSGQEGQEQLLRIVRSQILDAISSLHDRSESQRKKEGLSLAESFLPLEARLCPSGFNWLTQEDLQNQFALPSWQQTGLEFLSEGMMEMRRRKDMEEARRQNSSLELKKQGEEVIKTCEMEEGKREEREKNGENQPGSKELSTDPISFPNGNDTELPDPQPAPECEPDSEPNSDSDPELELTPSTPTAYFSHRLSRLQHFWTSEAKPIDFEFAKLVRRNILYNWRGEKLEPFNYSRWLLINSINQKAKHNEVGGIDDWLDTLDSSLQSGLDHHQEQGELKQVQRQDQRPQQSLLAALVQVDGTTGAGTGMGRDTGPPKKTYQQQADTCLLPYKTASTYPPSEPEWWNVADDMAALSDADDDEDILGFIGDYHSDSSDDEDEDDVKDQGAPDEAAESGNGNGRKKQDEEENEDGDENGDEVDEDLDEDRDSHPLIEYFREVSTWIMSVEQREYAIMFAHLTSPA